MSVTQTEVLVFKTDIKRKKDVQKISAALTIDRINQWTIDRDDIDCVLRVVTADLDATDIIGIITDHGYVCSELN